MYIYIYIERERERDMHVSIRPPVPFKWLATRNHERTAAFRPKEHSWRMFGQVRLKHANTEPRHGASTVAHCQLNIRVARV